MIKNSGPLQFLTRKLPQIGNIFYWLWLTVNHWQWITVPECSHEGFLIKGTELIAGRHVAQSNPQLSHSDSVSMISMRDLFSLYMLWGLKVKLQFTLGILFQFSKRCCRWLSLFSLWSQIIAPEAFALCETKLLHLATFATQTWIRLIYLKSSIGPGQTVPKCFCEFFLSWSSIIQGVFFHWYPP